LAGGGAALNNEITIRLGLANSGQLTRGHLSCG
jgi:hypothetical protein